MPVRIMLVDREAADLRRPERLFGLTHRVLCAGPGEEAPLRSTFPEEAESINWLGHPLAVEKEAAAFGVDHAQVGRRILYALAPDRLALLRLTRADLARIHEMTTEMVGEGLEGVAA